MAVVYFTAPQRVDFRVLVGQLARTLRARIDLRQVGSRDAARLTGGLGSCGRELCCATFLTDFEPVSLRMAKAQDLPRQPAADLRRLRPADVLPEVRAPAVRVSSPARCRPWERPSRCPRAKRWSWPTPVPADSVVLRMSATGQVSPCSRAAVCGARHAYEERSTPTGQRPSRSGAVHVGSRSDRPLGPSAPGGRTASPVCCWRSS